MTLACKAQKYTIDDDATWSISTTIANKFPSYDTQSWKENIRVSCGNSRATSLHQYDFVMSQNVKNLSMRPFVYQIILLFEYSDENT